jgi:hypothetical protein
MKNVSEIDVMKIINDNISQIQDPETRNRILRWAWEKFSTKRLLSEDEDEIRQKLQKKKKGKKTAKKSKTGPSLVKDLNLRPSGKETFEQFVRGKKPSSNQEKCLVAAYYLKYSLKGKADVNSIYTCFKFAHWRVPADLENTLCVIATQKGWLDTTDLKDIKIPTLGENYVEHDLPPKTKGKK